MASPMEFNGRPIQCYHEDDSQFSSQEQDLFVFNTLDAYDYNTDFQLSSAEFQSGVSATVIPYVDLNDVQNLVRPDRESPWTYGQPRTHHQIPSYDVTDTSTRAFTIAGDGKAEYNPTHRPELYPRFSQDSGIDSGLSDLQSISEAPESASLVYSGDTGLSTGYVTVPRPPQSVRSAKTAPIGKRRKGTKDVEISCLKPDCTKVSKNRSDAEKHAKQHLKLFKCTERGCRRVVGFGTPNDLERHRKTVHHKFPVVGKNTAYICAACPPEKEPKRWPRLDNFKAHVDRKHKGQDAAALIRNSEVPWVGSESGYGGSQDMDSHEYDELLSSISPSMSRHPSYASQAFAQDSADSLAGIGEGQVSGINSLLYIGNSTFRRTGGGVHANMLLQDRSLDQKTMLAVAPYAGSIQVSPNVPGILQDESLPADLDLVGMRPEQRIDDKNQKTIICPFPDCGKPKSRPSEYRKHLKRHTRPYGCTFTGCVMRLGSRNDWKRHESSQHELQEGWFCKACFQLYADHSTFSSHLQRVHKVPGRQLLQACGQAHLGPEGHYNFWCGFCADLIPQPDSNSQSEGRSMNPWEIRCKHVGDHYDKDEFLINSWVRIDNIPSPSSLPTMVSRPKHSPQTPVSHNEAHLPRSPNNDNISPWLAPPPSPSSAMARTNSTNTNTPSRVMITGDDPEQQHVSVFYPHDNGPLVRPSNAVDSFKEFGDFDDLRDAECEDDSAY